MTPDQEAILFDTGRAMASVLSANPALLRREGFDGRMNALLSESAIKEQLRNLGLRGQFAQIDPTITIESSKERAWYDVCMERTMASGERVSAFINIKVTEGKGADNIGSKLGVAYALTGTVEGISAASSWETFARFVRDNAPAQATGSDYYFLLIQKNTQGLMTRAVFHSLRRIMILVPNGANPPFQCNWGENIDKIAARSFEESSTYIREVLRTSLVKRYMAAKEAADLLA
jgi:hypothetical protein